MEMEILQNINLAPFKRENFIDQRKMETIVDIINKYPVHPTLAKLLNEHFQDIERAEEYLLSVEITNMKLSMAYNLASELLEQTHGSLAKKVLMNQPKNGFKINQFLKDCGA